MAQGISDSDVENLREGLAAGRLVSLLASLETLKSLFTEDLSFLSNDEVRRHSQFHNPEDAWSFYAGRRLLRSVLGLWVSRQELNLEILPLGKPVCAIPGAPHFNLSHGGGWLLLGFNPSSVIGVDVEDRRRKLPVESLAARFFSEKEQAAVCEQGAEAFFRIWTRKEARLKAEGKGLAAGGLSRLCTLEDTWQYLEFSPDPDSAACVAFPGEAREHQLFRL